MSRKRRKKIDPEAQRRSRKLIYTFFGVLILLILLVFLNIYFST